jgi:hypothetical protein
MSGDGEKGLDERLSGLERRLKRQEAGLGLLGLRPCNCCGTFYRRSDAGALCDCGELVCYDCIPRWWSQRSPKLSTEERQTVERELRQWLVGRHHAEVIGKLKDLPEPDRLMMKLVTGCEQCGGTGKTSGTGGICHHCDGRGTVWVIVRAPEFV